VKRRGLEERRYSLKMFDCTRGWPQCSDQISATVFARANMRVAIEYGAVRDEGFEDGRRVRGRASGNCNRFGQRRDTGNIGRQGITDVKRVDRSGHPSGIKERSSRGRSRSRKEAE
jgi:hypothetical protein